MTTEHIKTRLYSVPQKNRAVSVRSLPPLSSPGRRGPSERQCTMLIFQSNTRRFAFQRLADKFVILVYERPTGIFMHRVYHTPGDCFVAGAKVFWSLLEFAHNLKRMGFERVRQ